MLPKRLQSIAFRICVVIAIGASIVSVIFSLLTNSLLKG